MRISECCIPTLPFVARVCCNCRLRGGTTKLFLFPHLQAWNRAVSARTVVAALRASPAFISVNSSALTASARLVGIVASSSRVARAAVPAAAIQRRDGWRDCVRVAASVAELGWTLCVRSTDSEVRMDEPILRNAALFRSDHPKTMMFVR